MSAVTPTSNLRTNGLRKSSRGATETLASQRVALVVEDDPHLQKSMSKELRRAGFQVLSASHYAAAVVHLATRTPDVVFVDVSLPAQSGYELCEYIRGPLGLAGVAIIVTSEHGFPEDMAFAEVAGGNAFLQKPFSAGEMWLCLEWLLDRTTTSAPLSHELGLLELDGVDVTLASTRTIPAQGGAAASAVN